MTEQNRTPARPGRTPLEAYEQFCAACTLLGRALVRISDGIDRAGEHIAANSTSIAQAMDKLQRLGQGVDATIVLVKDTWNKRAVPILRIAERNAEEASRAAEIGTDLESAGWVPWIHAPVKELLGSADPVTLFDRWTTSEWDMISETLTKNIESYGVGESSVKAVRAALILHENGYYELVPRVLFPEIEKCVAERFYRAKIEMKETQLPKFRRAAEILWCLATSGFSLLAPALGIGRGQMQILALHSYVGSSKKNPPPELPNAEYFPNRNRVLHGWKSGDYDSPKASLNSLFLFDTMLFGLAITLALTGNELKIENNGTPEASN